uniref:Uncharacterized protein n=1 Tax=Oryza nivara TaxID=4536 RepID=A0A0E0IIZ1_ORYNI
MASSPLLRSAGGALRRSIPRTQSGYNQAFPSPSSAAAPSLAAANPRRLSSSDCGGSSTDPNKKLNTRKLEKNKEVGTSSRDADISDEELRKRMSSTADKLSRYLHEQTHLIRDIEVQLQDSNRYDQVKYFLVLVPSFVCVGLILDKMHVFG